ncbi:hypothetical protein ACFYVR_16510 [Rhodococcus sp. NPDC003318]|uniref:hypothetical protein n=1 Tax=Rhodococcus sp. NPDC003318 TaxID=3364503 RepID=UPI0036B26A18
MNDARGRARRRQQLEILMGVLGFVTVMAFVAAVVGIVRGEPGVTPSLVLLALVVALGLTVRAWMRLRRSGALVEVPPSVSAPLPRSGNTRATLPVVDVGDG